MNFALSLGFGVVETFFTIFLRGFGAQGITLGIAIGCYAAAKILFGPLMGALADRLGKKKTILCSLLLLSSTSLMYIFVREIPYLITLRMVQGIGFAMYRPALVAVIGESSGAPQRSTALGTFDISFYTAIGTAPLLGGIVKDIYGFSGLFPLLLCLCLAALCAFLFALASQGKDSGQHAPSLCLANRPSAENTTTHRPGARVFSGLLVYIFGRSCGIIIFISFLPVLLFQLNLSGAETGMIMASTTLATALTLRPMGKLADYVPRKLLVIAGGTAVSVLYCLIPSVSSFSEVYLLGICIGIFSAVAQPASSSMIFEEAVPFGTSFALGLVNTTLNLGFVIGSLIGSILQSAAGIASVFYGAGIIGLVAVALFVVLSKTPAIRKMQMLAVTTKQRACKTA